MNPAIYKFVDRYALSWLAFSIIFVTVGLCFVVLGGVMYVDDETVDVIDVETEDVSTTVETESEVTNNTGVLQEGEILRGSPLYLYSVNPELDINTEVEAQREADVETTVLIQYRGVEEEYEFWNEQEVIEESSMVVDADESAKQSTSITVPEVYEDAMAVLEDFDEDGDLEVELIVQTSYETDEYSGDIEMGGDFLFRDETYSVMPPELRDSQSHEIEVEAEEPDETHVTIWEYALKLLAISLILLVAHRLSDHRRSEHDYERIRYSDWVTRVEVVDVSEFEKNVIGVDSIKGLVDIGIDTQERVLWVAEEERYVLVTETLFYEYDVSDLECDESDDN